MIELNDDIKRQLQLSNDLYRKGYLAGLEEGFESGRTQGYREATQAAMKIVDAAFKDFPKQQAD